MIRPSAVFAIVTAYNRADYLKTCLKSLLDSVEEGLEIHVLVIDNGSADNTAAVAESFGPRVEVSRMPRNMPMGYVLYTGFTKALADPRAQYVLLLNDDTALQKGALRTLIEACEAHPNALLSPLQINYWKPDHLDDRAFKLARENRALFEDLLLERPLKQVYAVNAIVGAGLLARREAYLGIGEWDQLFSFYGIDDDYVVRAHYLGYEVLLVPRAQMWHAHGRAMDSRQEDPVAWWRRWRNHQEARFLLLLKDPKRPLLVNYGRAALFWLWQCLRFVPTLWLKGILVTTAYFFRMLAAYPRVRRAYQRDFDPARRISRS